MKLALLLVLFTAGAAAQTEQDGAQQQHEEQTGGASSTTGSTAREGSQNEPQGKPTRFVPKETISPDSVISFPADI